MKRFTFLFAATALLSAPFALAQEQAPSAMQDLGVSISSKDARVPLAKEAKPKLPKIMLVGAPVAELFEQPFASVDPQKPPKVTDQLLMGSRVKVLSIEGKWAKVECIDTPYVSDEAAGDATSIDKDKWSTRPGYVFFSRLVEGEEYKGSFTVNSATATARVKTDTGAEQELVLFMGTPLRVASGGGDGAFELPDGRTAYLQDGDVYEGYGEPNAYRLRVVETARKFIWVPYVWGGTTFRGIDCSGLTSTSMRMVGFSIPRTAHEQYLASRKKDTGSILRAGDFIFIASKDKPRHMHHVMMYTGKDTIIEAPRTGLTVREISLLEKSGISFDGVPNGTNLKGRIVYFGTFFDD